MMDQEELRIKVQLFGPNCFIPALVFIIHARFKTMDDGERERERKRERSERERERRRNWELK